MMEQAHEKGAISLVAVPLHCILLKSIMASAFGLANSSGVICIVMAARELHSNGIKFWQVRSLSHLRQSDYAAFSLGEIKVEQMKEVLSCDAYPVVYLCVT